MISTLDVFKKIFSEVGIESIPNQTPQKLERIDSMRLINQAQILINQSIFTCHKQVRDMLQTLLKQQFLKTRIGMIQKHKNRSLHPPQPLNIVAGKGDARIGNQNEISQTTEIARQRLMPMARSAQEGNKPLPGIIQISLNLIPKTIPIDVSQKALILPLK